MRTQAGKETWRATTFIAAVSLVACCSGTPDGSSGSGSTNTTATTNNARSSNGATNNATASNGATNNVTNGATNNPSGVVMVEDIGGVDTASLLAEAEAALARRVDGMPCGAVNDRGTTRLAYGYDELGQLVATRAESEEPSELLSCIGSPYTLDDPCDYPTGWTALRIDVSDSISREFVFSENGRLVEVIDTEIGSHERIVSRTTYRECPGCSSDMVVSSIHQWDYAGLPQSLDRDSRWTVRLTQGRSFDPDLSGAAYGYDASWDASDRELVFTTQANGDSLRLGFDSTPTLQDLRRLWHGAFPHADMTPLSGPHSLGLTLDNVFELDARLDSAAGVLWLGQAAGFGFGPSTFGYDVRGRLGSIMWDEAGAGTIEPEPTTRTTTFSYDCTRDDP